MFLNSFDSLFGSLYSYPLNVLIMVVLGQSGPDVQNFEV